MTHPQRIPFVQLNVAPPNEGRTHGGLLRTLRAVNNTDPKDRRRANPKLIGLEETIGWGTLPALPGKRLIRSTHTAGEANLALYVSEQLKVTNVRWIPCRHRWPRTEHDGLHDPRAILKARVADLRVVVAHAPPDAPGTDEARKEWVVRVAELFDTDMDVVLLCDPNGLLDDVRRMVGAGRVFGLPGDGVMVKGFTLENPTMRRVVNGVPVQTDHGNGCLLGRAVRR